MTYDNTFYISIVFSAVKINYLNIHLERYFDDGDILTYIKYLIVNL